MAVLKVYDDDLGDWVPAVGGDMVGPASATDNALARFDLTTGRRLQNSTVLLDDAGTVWTLGGTTNTYKNPNGDTIWVTSGPNGAVNYLQAVASTTGNGVILAAVGTDADVDVLLVSQGAGVIKADGIQVATLTGTEVLTNKTLTTPTIASLVNATHDHSSAAGGGTLAAKLRTQTKVFYIEDYTSSDVFRLFYTGVAITIVLVVFKVASGTYTFNLEYRNQLTPASSSGTQLWTSDEVADSTGEANTTFDDADVPADKWVTFVASAQSGLATSLDMAIVYTVD